MSQPEPESTVAILAYGPTNARKLTAEGARALLESVGIDPTLAADEPYRMDKRDGWEHRRGVLPESPGLLSYPPEGLEHLRGFCPDCGAAAVFNEYYNPAHGYLTRYECWTALLTDGESCRWRAIP